MTNAAGQPAIHPQRTTSTGPGATGPAQALELLLAGNRRFVSGRPRHGHDVTSPAGRRTEQHPHALVLGCMDSRVPPEAVFDQDLGAILVARTAGHVLDAAVLGSVEYAVSALRVPLVVVLGHRYCGAIHAATDAMANGRYPGGALGRLVEAILPAVLEAGSGAANPIGTWAAAAQPGEEAIIRRHVARTVEQIVGGYPAAGRPWGVAGAHYDVGSGRVEVTAPLA